MNNKKTLTILAGVITLVVIIIAVVILSKDKKVENNPTDTTSVETTEFENPIVDEDETPGELKIPETDENGEEVTEKKTKPNKKKNNKDKETTNYWDTIDVIEDVNETETVTDENGEVIPEEYPGQNSGWSPIVKPEDLE